MQKLIAEYLFQHKKCSLPEAGTLEIRNTEATAEAGQKKITPPVPVIHFTDQTGDTTDLHNYIAAGKGISVDEAAYELNKFCEELKSLTQGEKYNMPDAGHFYINPKGKLDFIPETIPAYYLPVVNAERVVHEGNSHSIMVGDRETTNTAMAEYYSEDIRVKRTTWRIWAAVLLVLAAAAIVFYLNDDRRNSFFGNSTKPEVKAAGTTYRNLP